MPGKATLVVTGELTIAPDVTAQMLAERLLKVHNMGRIVCAPEQMAVIESRLGLREGQLVDSTQKPEEDETEADAGGIGNVNILEM